MEPTQLQLVLNVVTITGLSSLAGYCYLLKKENHRLATAVKADPTVKVKESLPAPAPVVEQDIRQFAAGRRTGWVKGMASTTNSAS